MEISKLPKLASWVSKEVANELSTIEQSAKKHIRMKAGFAKQNGLAALFLRDEHCLEVDGHPDMMEINLGRSWYRTKDKFHKGDRVLLVNASNAGEGTVLQLSRHADRFDWHHPHLPSNLHWYCKVISTVPVPGAHGD